jgi:hypothetical protein
MKYRKNLQVVLCAHHRIDYFTILGSRYFLLSDLTNVTPRPSRPRRYGDNGIRSNECRAAQALAGAAIVWRVLSWGMR